MPDDAPVRSPHDQFFKQAFGRVEVARDFFQAYLPARVVSALDWPTLQLAPGSFVDERLAGRASDLLYSVRLRDRPALLYCLFEHQSTVDADMPFRLLLYMARIWEDWRKQAVAGARPPLILPLVLYQGATAWTVSRQFHDWLELPDDLRADLAPFQPRFEHALVDLSRLPLEDIAGELMARLALSLMKAVRGDGLPAWLAVSVPRLAELLAQPDRAGFFRVLMTYAFQAETISASTFEAAVASVQDATVKTNAMSIAEQLIQRGRQEGWQKGQQEGWQKDTRATSSKQVS